MKDRNKIYEKKRMKEENEESKKVKTTYYLRLGMPQSDQKTG